MTTDTTEQTASDKLELPVLDTLTEQQVRGTACVWDGVPLGGIRAFDLGPREGKRLGTPFSWFPRGCPTCTMSQAQRALQVHAPTCDECKGDDAPCEIGRGLYRLMRGARQS